MGLLSNLVDGLKVKNNDEDEEYYLDDDYFDDEEDYVDEEEDDEPKKPGFISKFAPKKPSASVDEAPKSSLFGKRNNVVPMQQNSMEVVMKRPKDVNDSTAICDELLDGKAVVINLEGVDGGVAQRIIDFTLGSIYSIEGDIQQISTFIFIASPHSIELSGDFKGDFSKSYIKADSSRTANTGYSF